MSSQPEQHVGSSAEKLVPVTAKDLATPGLDEKSKEALRQQLYAWVRLAKFATWLSVGLAIASVLLCVFLLSAMTWGGLFKGSGLWEFTFILFALAVFVASPLTIFVIGRPLKGVDEWAPALSMTGKHDEKK